MRQSLQTSGHQTWGQVLKYNISWAIQFVMARLLRIEHPGGLPRYLAWKCSGRHFPWDL